MLRLRRSLRRALPARKPLARNSPTNIGSSCWMSPCGARSCRLRPHPYRRSGPSANRSWRRISRHHSTPRTELLPRSAHFSSAEPWVSGTRPMQNRIATDDVRSAERVPGLRVSVTILVHCDVVDDRHREQRRRAARLHHLEQGPPWFLVTRTASAFSAPSTGGPRAGNSACPLSDPTWVTRTAPSSGPWAGATVRPFVTLPILVPAVIHGQSRNARPASGRDGGAAQERFHD